jgi:hypothetical protein
MEANRLAMAKVKRPQAKQVAVEVEQMDNSPEPLVQETNIETPKDPVPAPEEEAKEPVEETLVEEEKLSVPEIVAEPEDLVPEEVKPKAKKGKKKK